MVTAGSQCWPNCVATAAAHNERGLILAQIIPANGKWVSLLLFNLLATVKFPNTATTLYQRVNAHNSISPVLAEVLVQALWLCESQNVQVSIILLYR